MKPSLLAATALFLSAAFLHAAPPTLPIDQALKIAMDHLKERGLAGEHFITSLTLEDSSLTHGEKYWFARWVPAIRVEKKFESGLQINMDGTLARVTSGAPGGGRPDDPAHRPIGARNIR